MSKVYYYCGLIVGSLLLDIILRFNPMVLVTLDKNVFNIDFFDYCDRKIGKYWFYYSYFNILKQKKISKFSFINKVNVVIYQDYLPPLEILTLIKKMLIA